MRYELKSMIDEAEQWARGIYRHLHAFPETGNEEFGTAGFIEERLREIGLESRRPLPTSVSAEQGEWQSGKRRLVLRADIDALPIREETGLEFASRREGFMHACGHDAHTAVVLGTAMVLSKVFNINVKYIFQQDEEGSGGGRRIAESGELRPRTETEDGDTVIGLHVRPSLPAGCIGLREGAICGASRMFDLTVRGLRSHGALPHLGRDAIAAAGAIICGAQGIVSRRMDPAEPVVVGFGKIQGGSGRNILADEVRLEGIIRGERSEPCRQAAEELERLCRGIGAACGVAADLSFAEGYPPVVNDGRIVRRLRAAAAAAGELWGGRIDVVDIDRCSLTVDDFAYYTQVCEGAYFYIGSGYADRENSELHTGTFCIDERCIRTGIEVLTAFACDSFGIFAKK